MTNKINIYHAKHRVFGILKMFSDFIFGKNFSEKIKGNKKNIVENIKNKASNEVDISNSRNSFQWRGLHLDVARHFMSIDYLYELIDKMYVLGLNVFHLHLSDDQGFRFESKKYPRLHTIGGYRNETVVAKKFPFFGSEYVGDDIPHRGYYKQEELKKFVVYARSHGITVVPEIDIPGHATAILAAYPEYSHGEAPKTVATSWGVFDNILRADEKTLSFLKDVFDEVMNVFDGNYIHIGGDEVHVDNYDKNFLLQKVAEHIKNKNRTPIMWDEAWKVAKSVDGIIMAWQSLEDMQKVLSHKVKTICCSSSHLYFDYYQHPNILQEPLAIGGYTSIEKVNSLDLNDLNIKPEYEKYLIGAQAQMWTEYTKTSKDVDYMLFPRLNAFSNLFQKK